MSGLRKFPVVNVNEMTLELQIDDHFKQYMIEKFEDELKGIHYIFKFPNDYGASVIKGKYTYGCERDLWEMGLIFFNENGDWLITYERDFDDDVKGYLTDDNVNELLEKIKKY